MRAGRIQRNEVSKTLVITLDGIFNIGSLLTDSDNNLVCRESV